MSKFKIGDKIKLKYDKISTHPDYTTNKTSEELGVKRYHDFVESNKDNILTIKVFADSACRFVRVEECPEWIIHETYLDIYKNK